LGQIVDDVEEWLQKKHFLTPPEEVINIIPAQPQPSLEKPLDQETNPINIDRIINEVNDTSTFIQDGIKQIQQQLEDTPPRKEIPPQQNESDQ
jgi:hypothetical protein